MGPHAGVLRDVVHALKYDARRSTAAPLAALMRDSGARVLSGAHLLVPVPLLWQRVPPAGLLWLLAGGIAYSAGDGFYAAKRVRYGHFLWHLFVLAGSACHLVAVFSYAT